MILYWILLMCHGTAVGSEVHYIISPSHKVPSQSQHCGDQCSSNAEAVSMDNCLTLSQFTNNSTDYLTNDTMLIFSPGNYSLESELVIKDVPSFSMVALPSFTSNSKVIIVCGHNARFEFSNISNVTVSRLEFVRCFENHVVSVGQFQLKDSSFLGHDQALVSSMVMTIEDSAANLDRVAFISVLQQPEINCTLPISSTDKVIGISLKRSIIRITQSWFEGNSMLLGGLIYYDQSGSDVMIVNTTFVNNTAINLYAACQNCFDCNITASIVYAESNGGVVEVYNSKFVQNIGVLIFGNDCNSMLITHTKFINNEYRYNGSCLTEIVYAINTNMVITHSTFSNNTEILYVRHTNMSVSHSEFSGNYLRCFTAVLLIYDAMFTSIDHSKFIGNSASFQILAINTNMNSSRNTNMSLSYSEFVGNTGGVLRCWNMNVVCITHSEFVNNNGYSALVNSDGYEYWNMNVVRITHSEFVNNTGDIDNSRLVYVGGVMITISLNKFINNKVSAEVVYIRYSTIFTSIDHSKFIGNSASFQIHAINTNMNALISRNTNMSLSYSEFVGNTGGVLRCWNMNVVCITHSEFVNNNGYSALVNSDGYEYWSMNVVRITHSEFINNTGDIDNSKLVYVGGVMITISLNEFINNKVSTEVVHVPYSTTDEDLTNNVFINNIATYSILIGSNCRPGLSLSLGSPRCIPCSDYWLQNMIGIVIAAFIAGIALVIFMLALDMTVAVGTLNGVLFYANIVAVNADTYFFPFMTSNFVTIFISWLNLDIGFDACFFVEISTVTGTSVAISQIYKALIQLAFPTYVIVLVIIVIVASEYSSKFAKLIGKGNPAAVLATMLLLSYAKFFNVIITSCSLLYFQPGYGSHMMDVSRISNVGAAIERSNDTGLKASTYILIVASVLILLLCIIYTALVFSWQWLLQYQDKIIFKWVRYQKLHHFLEPYHAPYTAKHRYWTGLQLIVRAFLYLSSILNFSLDPRVELMSTIFVVGALILLKGVIAKRVYKNWLLDLMETAIYFNLVAFSALTWYNLDFDGNQVAVAYTSVMIVFILVLGVTIFHVLRYTRLYKCSFIEKGFKWISTKLIEKKPIQNPPNDVPEELDGYQLERTAAGDRELPTITYSTVEIHQPTQDQEEI